MAIHEIIIDHLWPLMGWPCIDLAEYLPVVELYDGQFMDRVTCSIVSGVNLIV